LDGQGAPLSNDGGIITLLDPEGLKHHGVCYTKKQAPDVLNTVKRVNMSAHRLDTFLALASVNIGTTIENISYIPAG